MEAVSRIRPVRRWRILLAHDATAPTCDILASTLENALGSVDLTDTSSVDDARVTLETGRFHVCLVCLDLPPAPLGGVRLAQEVVGRTLPLVLVTRSLRWIPPSADGLREIPWIAPDASTTDIARAITQAMAKNSGVRLRDSWIDAETSSSPISASARH